MKRHEALVTLSSEHHQGLVWSKKLLDLTDSIETRESQSILQEFFEVWHQEINPHFQKEEQILLPLFDRTDAGTAEPVIEMFRQHIHLRAKVYDLNDAPSLKIAHAVGEQLKDHIRFEERDLFPFIEEHSSVEVLERIKIALENA